MTRQGMPMELVKDWEGRFVSDRYELAEYLFVTETNSLFKAWDHYQQQYVIIKIAEANSKHLLKREVLALDRLKNFSSPRIVRLVNHGNFENSYFIALEYIHGTNLYLYLDQMKRLPVDTCISVGVELLEGIEVLHKASLVHRDLKPTNLVISNVGVKIVDFGIAAFVSQTDHHLTWPKRSGHWVGTQPYLSPEQFFVYEDLDTRSDLYACGIILYQLLTGVLPFDEFFDEKNMAIYWDLPLRKFPVGIPERIQAIVWKALQVDRNLRYQTATEMKDFLLAELGTYTKIPVL